MSVTVHVACLANPGEIPFPHCVPRTTRPQADVCRRTGLPIHLRLDDREGLGLLAFTGSSLLSNAGDMPAFMPCPEPSDVRSCLLI
jgi:hypothetical protein